MFETAPNPAIGGLDLVVPQFDDGTFDLDISTANPLPTLVYLSLFTDARAEPGDQLPARITDRRGWPGDAQVGALDDYPRPLGSKIWTWLWRPLVDSTIGR